jgi:hypothetical protein
MDNDRRLVSFYARGGKVRKKSCPEDEVALKKGGRTKKAKGGPVAAAAPTNPMEGRLNTGAVALAPKGRKRMPTLGGPLTGALSRIG